MKVRTKREENTIKIMAYLGKKEESLCYEVAVWMVPELVSGVVLSLDLALCIRF